MLAGGPKNYSDASGKGEEREEKGR